MYNLLARKGQLFGFLLGLFIVLAFLISVFSGLDAFNEQTEDQQMTTSIFNFGLMGAIVLAVICLVAALLFGIYHLLTNLKGSMKFLIAFGALLILFFILYAMYDPSSSSAIQDTITEFGVSDGVSQVISAAISTSLMLVLATIVGAVVFEIVNLFK